VLAKCAEGLARLCKELAGEVEVFAKFDEELAKRDERLAK